MAAALVLRHLDAFRHVLGVDVVDGAIGRLPPVLEAEVSALVPGAWLAVDKVDIVYTSIAKAGGRELEELFPIAIERGNEAAFSTVWKALLRMAPGRLILRRATTLFEKSYTHGVLTATDVEGGAELVLSHWPGVTRNRLLGTAAGMRAAFKLAGKPGADVMFEFSEDGATFYVQF